MSFANPMDFLRDLCRAVGIDPINDPVYSVTIIAKADGSLPRIVVEKPVSRGQAREIVELVDASGITPEVVVIDLTKAPE